MSKNFQGFSKATIKFFNNLKANNNKTWFENHRKEYEADILNPMRALVSDLSGHMLKIDSLFEVTPAIDKTISIVTPGLPKINHLISQQCGFLSKGQIKTGKILLFIFLKLHQSGIGMVWVFIMLPQ